MHRFFLTLARVAAILGGAILTFLILLTVLSVAGRALNGLFHSLIDMGIFPGLAQGMLDLGVGPVMGDFELVEAGVAFCIFAFIPITQITGGHATVDVLTSQFSPRVNRVLIAFWEVIFAIALIVIAWRLFVGMEGKMKYNETTMLLQFPIWWAYGASFLGAALAAVVAVYVAFARVTETLTGRVVLMNDGGAGH